jgi:hypothetical protein
MNDKWFNVAMIIVFTSLVANGLIFMLTSFPNGGQFSNLSHSNLDYNTSTASVGNAYVYQVGGANNMSAEASSNSAGTLITSITGDPFGLSPLNLLASAFFGLEALLLSLANIFTMFGFLFTLFALIAFTVKMLVAAYFGSVIVRGILGWLS